MARPPGGPPPGRARDLTSGPIAATLIAFALPTLGSNVLQSLNGSVNAVWVGQFLGEGALSATANANIIMFLMFSAVFGFGMAATVMVGQAAGRHDHDAARRALGSALGFCAILAIIVCVIGWFSSAAILRALGTPEGSFELAHDYLRVTFIAMPFTLVSVMLAMGLRGMGDAVTPLIYMAVSVVIDVIFNPLLILGLGPFPKLGITGSALSTAIAGLVSLTAMTVHIYVKDLPIRLKGAEISYLWPRWSELRYILVKGLPMGAQMILLSAAGLIMIGLVNQEGLLTSAAYSAVLQLQTYIQMPALAIGAAVSAMAAQNIGAGRWDRVGRVTSAGVVTNVAITGAVVALLLLFDRPMIMLFLGDGSPAVAIATHIQLLTAWSFIMFGVTIILFSTMRANGFVIGPLVILAIALYPARLGFYWVMHPHIGADAIWLSFPAGSVVSMSLAALAYRYAPWRKGAVPIPMEDAKEQAEACAEPAGRTTPQI